MPISLKLPMNKKSRAATFLLAFVFFSVAILQSVSLVSANAVPYPSVPNTDLPTLTVQTPQNYSDSYAAKEFTLNFAVTKPNSWNSYWMGETSGLPVIGSYVVLVYLDETLNCLRYDPCLRDVFTSSFSVVLGELTSEPHVLKIDVLAGTYYKNASNSGNQTGQDNLLQSNVTQTIHFTLNADSKTLLFTADPQVITREPYPSPYDSSSPLPSTSPSLSPSPSPQETENQSEPQPFPTVLVAASVASVAVAGVVVVVYFDKAAKGKGKRV